MLRRMRGNTIFCGLDIGTEAVKAAMVQMGQTEGCLIGAYETAVRGISGPRVTDLAALTDCIQEVMQGLIRRTKVRVGDVALGIGGDLLEIREGSAACVMAEWGSRTVTQGALRRLRNQAGLLRTGLAETLVHVIPREYRVDDVPTRAPVGMYGRKVEVDTLVVVAPRALLQNLTAAANGAGYEVRRTASSLFGAARAAMAPELRNRGGVLVDIGGRRSVVMAVRQETVLRLETVGLGGRHITESLAGALRIPFDLAEEIKKSYATAAREAPEVDEEILLKAQEGYLPVRKTAIDRAIQPVTGKLVQALGASLSSVSKTLGRQARVVLVGGGGLLAGFAEWVEEVGGLPTDLGQLQGIGNRLHNAASFASAVGLALGEAEGGLRLSGTEPATEARWLRRAATRIRELYADYF